MSMSPRLLRPRATGFDPKSVANLAAWYDASVSASITLNGSNVSQWNDQSGLGRHLVQSVAANQPAYATNTLNGRPVVTFDGSDDFMNANASASGVTNSTFAIVMRFITETAEDIPLGLGVVNQTRAIRAFYRATGQSNLRFATWANESPESNSLTNTGNHRVFTARQNGSEVVIRANGAGASYQLPSAPLAVNSNTLWMGNFNNTGVYASNVSVAEALVYYADVGENALGSIERYLGAKYGITLA